MTINGIVEMKGPSRGGDKEVENEVCGEDQGVYD